MGYTRHVAQALPKENPNKRLRHPAGLVGTFRSAHMVEMVLVGSLGIERFKW